MSDIDPQKLEEALDVYDTRVNLSPRAKVVIAAARAHLATLPRYKDVEVMTWLLVDPTGTAYTAYHDEGQARRTCPDEWQVVKLTGTARVKV